MDETLLETGQLGDVQSRRLRRSTRIATGLVVLLLAVPIWFGITAHTGFPGPGVLRRYPLSDLDALVDKINTANGGQTPYLPCSVTPKPTPSVDLLHARVDYQIDNTPAADALSDEELAMLLGQPKFRHLTYACA